MEQSREIIHLGLQVGDACHLITDAKQHLYLKVAYCTNGYLKLEIDMPKRYWAERIPGRCLEEKTSS